MIVRDLLRSVFRICQVIGPGENLDKTPEESDAFEALNSLIGAWAARRIFIYNTIIEKFNLSNGVFEYTFGKGGQWDSERPQFLKESFISDDNIDYNLKIISQDEYFHFSNKKNSGRPSYLYFEKKYPLGNVFLYTTPDKNYKITISSYKQLSAFESVEDMIELPPYYSKALKFNLAIEIAPEYAQELIPSVMFLASDSLKNLLIGNQNEVPQSSFGNIFNYMRN